MVLSKNGIYAKVANTIRNLQTNPYSLIEIFCIRDPCFSAQWQTIEDVNIIQFHGVMVG